MHNARLNDMAIARANMRKEHALKLRVVQNKYAAQVAVHARALERHARKLQHLHAKINAEAIATAGADSSRFFVRPAAPSCGEAVGDAE